MKKIILSFMIMLSILSALLVGFASADDNIDDAKQAYNRNNPPPSEIILADGQGTISQEEQHRRLNIIQNEDGTISINNDFTIIEFPDAQPFFENDRLLVPVRFISEALGAEVHWFDDIKTVTIIGEQDICMTIGEMEYGLNQKTMQMDVAPKIINDRTYVPIRFVAEALGYEVDWFKNIYE